MKSVLKSFRLKQIYNDFLEDKSEEIGVTQVAILEAALEKFMASSNQWENDLTLISEDEVYKKEQRDLANEYYEDF